jgi:hypothetical protein
VRIYHSTDPSPDWSRYRTSTVPGPKRTVTCLWLRRSDAQSYTAVLIGLSEQVDLKRGEETTRFERFTEKARRVIFFARYEASQYGSPVIEIEHLLLGLLREDGHVVLRFLRAKATAAQFRTQIETHVTQRERISTAVEVPLTDECKKILILAKEESDNFRHRYIGTEHLLLAMLECPASLAARLLIERGVDTAAIREQIAKTSGPENVKERIAEEYRISQGLEEATSTLESFLAGVKAPSRGQMASFFAHNSRFVDCNGKCWVGSAEIQKQFELLFAPYSKKNVSCRLETVEMGLAETVLGSILWENVAIGVEPLRSLHPYDGCARVAIRKQADVLGGVIGSSLHLIECAGIFSV